MAEHPEKIEDAFYRDLAFGTGELRGVIGAGTNRVNVRVVGKASQGLAEYRYPEGSARRWSSGMTAGPITSCSREPRRECLPRTASGRRTGRSCCRCRQ